MNRHKLIVAIMLAASLASATASADKEDDASRAVLVHKLLDIKVGDAGQTWSAFSEVCGEECEYVAYGGCKRNDGAVDCEVRVYDGTEKKTKIITVKQADSKPAALAKAKVQLTAALSSVGWQPTWLKENRFDTPPQSVGDQNTRFQWDWKSKTLTLIVRDGKKVFKKFKAGKLGKGLGITSAAVWFNDSEDNASDYVLLRIHGEGDEGASGDAVTLFVLRPGM